MQKEKHEEIAIFMYLIVLLSVVLINLFSKISIFDLAYLFVVVCCFFKVFLIVRDSKE